MIFTQIAPTLLSNIARSCRTSQGLENNCAIAITAARILGAYRCSVSMW
jgi:hypothetical protein